MDWAPNNDYCGGADQQLHASLTSTLLGNRSTSGFGRFAPEKKVPGKDIRDRRMGSRVSQSGRSGEGNYNFLRL
jgi:hypothetical protein